MTIHSESNRNHFAFLLQSNRDIAIYSDQLASQINMTSKSQPHAVQTNIEAKETSLGEAAGTHGSRVASHLLTPAEHRPVEVAVTFGNRRALIILRRPASGQARTLCDVQGLDHRAAMSGEQTMSLRRRPSAALSRDRIAIWADSRAAWLPEFNGRRCEGTKAQHRSVVATVELRSLECTAPSI